MDKSHILFYSKKAKYVIFKISATWCEPCKYAAPYIKKCHLSTEERIQQSIPCIEIDYDEDRDAVRFLRVQKVPTLIMYINGEMHHVTVGSSWQNIEAFYNRIR